jgi:hypothetical protein
MLRNIFVAVAFPLSAAHAPFTAEYIICPSVGEVSPVPPLLTGTTGSIALSIEFPFAPVSAKFSNITPVASTMDPASHVVFPCTPERPTLHKTGLVTS